MFRIQPSRNRALLSSPNPASTLLQSGLLPAIILTLLFVLVFMVLPARGQTSVPPTAKQAAASPAFAHRLHHSGARATQPAPAYDRSRIRNPQVLYLYANGPVNGICDIENCNTDAWTINFGYAVSNSIGTGGIATAFEFAFWMFPGDSVISVDWLLGTQPFAGDIASGTATGANLSQSELFVNSYGYQIEDVQVSGLNVNAASGAWLTLQNAVTTQGNPLYWDENSGPSAAQDNVLGTIPSESFNVQGAPGGCYTERQQAPQELRSQPLAAKSSLAPAQNFQVIHNFVNGNDGANPAAGPTVDRAANVYGPTSLIYKMSDYNSQWLFDPLYSFQGGSDGSYPSAEVTVGPDGSLYGTTYYGGNSACYLNLGCGTVFKVRPGANAPANVFGGWSDEILYRFTNGADGANPSSRLIFDSAGNLYGTTQNGGLYGAGSVFELTPGAQGWTYNLIYSFTGGSGGAKPLSDLMFDQAGNLYGATYTGGFANCGTIYEVTPSGGSWTQKTLYTFHGQSDSGNPLGLVMDRAGNLYGNTIGAGCYGGVCDQGVGASTVFMLSQSGGNWTYTVLNNYSGLYQSDISVDPAGSLYVDVAFPSYVFRLSWTGSSWAYTDLHDFTGDDGFWPNGKVAFDSAGNLYGVTNQGGTNSEGVLYQIAP